MKRLIHVLATMPPLWYIGVGMLITQVGLRLTHTATEQALDIISTTATGLFVLAVLQIIRRD